MLGKYYYKVSYPPSELFAPLQLKGESSGQKAEGLIFRTNYKTILLSFLLLTNFRRVLFGFYRNLNNL